MDICFHVGAHFCGGAGFQRYIEQNQLRLTAAGCAFWGSARVKDGLFAGLLTDRSRGLDKRAQRSLGRIQIALQGVQSTGADRLVISAADLIGRTDLMFASGSLYPDLRMRLSRIAAGFGGRPLRIGLTIRSYETFWAAALGARVIQGYAMPRPERLRELSAQPRRWRDVITDISRAFPEADISVWSFEAVGAQPGLQFYGLTGKMPPRAMLLPKMSAKATRIDRIATIARERGEALAIEHTSDAEGDYQPFAEDQIIKLRQDYAEDIDWLINGSDGLATFFDPMVRDAAVFIDARGRDDDRQERLGSPRHQGAARARAG